MSAFALPMPPGALAGLPSPAYGTLRYRTGEQKSDDRRQNSHQADAQLLQHPRHHLIFVPPLPPGTLVEIAEIERVPRPHPHLVARADRHLQKALELRFRLRLTTVALGNVRADRLARRRI
jgi:hypothetical protein